MMTAYAILKTNGDIDVTSVDWPAEPDFEIIRSLVEPLLDGADLEQVSVLHEGKRRDMFVDDSGHLKGLPRNEQATRIYRAATLSRQPHVNPETLPCIVGPAVLFYRRVWF